MAGYFTARVVDKWNGARAVGEIIVSRVMNAAWPGHAHSLQQRVLSRVESVPVTDQCPCG